MTSVKDDGYRPLNLPKCTCFNFDEDPDFAMKQCACATQMTGQLAGELMHDMMDAHMCRVAMPFVMENLIIQLVTQLALMGTVIEAGTNEALWESERVLNGLEARVLAQMRHAYEHAQKRGLTQKIIDEARKTGKWTI
jgi:hypothetical protein